MNYLEPAFIANFLTGLTFLLAGWLLKAKPPKNINGLYGYRTTRSMKSKEAWDFAQVLGGKVMMKVGIVLMVMGVFFSFISLPIWLSLSLTIFPLIVALIYMIVSVERALKQRFGQHC